MFLSISFSSIRMHILLHKHKDVIALVSCALVNVPGMSGCVGIRRVCRVQYPLSILLCIPKFNFCYSVRNANPVLVNSCSLIIPFTWKESFTILCFGFSAPFGLAFIPHICCQMCPPAAKIPALHWALCTIVLEVWESFLDKSHRKKYSKEQEKKGWSRFHESWQCVYLYDYLLSSVLVWD